jgi:hypothetical protein
MVIIGIVLLLVIAAAIFFQSSSYDSKMLSLEKSLVEITAKLTAARDFDESSKQALETIKNDIISNMTDLAESMSQKVKSFDYLTDVTSFITVANLSSNDSLVKLYSENMPNVSFGDTAEKLNQFIQFNTTETDRLVSKLTDEAKLTAAEFVSTISTIESKIGNIENLKYTKMYNGNIISALNGLAKRLETHSSDGEDLDKIKQTIDSLTEYYASSVYWDFDKVSKAIAPTLGLLYQKAGPDSIVEIQKLLNQVLPRSTGLLAMRQAVNMTRKLAYEHLTYNEYSNQLDKVELVIDKEAGAYKTSEFVDNLQTAINGLHGKRVLNKSDLDRLIKAASEFAIPEFDFSYLQKETTNVSETQSVIKKLKDDILEAKARFNVTFDINQRSRDLEAITTTLGNWIQPSQGQVSIKDKISEIETNLSKGSDLSNDISKIRTEIGIRTISENRDLITIASNAAAIARQVKNYIGQLPYDKKLSDLVTEMSARVLSLEHSLQYITPSSVNVLIESMGNQINWFKTATADLSDFDAKKLITDKAYNDNLDSYISELAKLQSIVDTTETVSTTNDKINAAIKGVNERLNEMQIQITNITPIANMSDSYNTSSTKYLASVTQSVNAFSLAVITKSINDLKTIVESIKIPDALPEIPDSSMLKKIAESNEWTKKKDALVKLVNVIEYLQIAGASTTGLADKLKLVIANLPQGTRFSNTFVRAYSDFTKSLSSSYKTALANISTVTPLEIKNMIINGCFSLIKIVLDPLGTPLASFVSESVASFDTPSIVPKSFALGGVTLTEFDNLNTSANALANTLGEFKQSQFNALVDRVKSVEAKMGSTTNTSLDIASAKTDAYSLTQIPTTTDAYFYVPMTFNKGTLTEGLTNINYSTVKVPHNFSASKLGYTTATKMTLADMYKYLAPIPDVNFVGSPSFSVLYFGDASNAVLVYNKPKNSNASFIYELIEGTYTYSTANVATIKSPFSQSDRQMAEFVFTVTRRDGSTAGSLKRTEMLNIINQFTTYTKTYGMTISMYMGFKVTGLATQLSSGLTVAATSAKLSIDAKKKGIIHNAYNDFSKYGFLLKGSTSITKLSYVPSSNENTQNAMCPKNEYACGLTSYLTTSTDTSTLLGQTGQKMLVAPVCCNFKKD